MLNVLMPKFKTRPTQKCVFMSPKISAVFSHSSTAGGDVCAKSEFETNPDKPDFYETTSSELQSDMKICPETEWPFFTKAVSGAGVAVTKQSLQHQAHYYIIHFKKTKQCGHRDAAEFHQGVFLLCVSWQRHKTSSRERCTHSGV